MKTYLHYHNDFKYAIAAPDLAVDKPTMKMLRWPMYKFSRFILSLALIAAFPSISMAGTITPVVTLKGGPPPVHMVEQSHQAFRLWYRAGHKKRGLLLIGSTPGLVSAGDAYTANVLSDASKGLWDNLLEKDYPTSRFHPVNTYNYLFFLYKSGVIDKVYWVPPSKESVGKEPLDGFKDYLKTIGVKDAELAGLKQTKDSIYGSINGMPIQIYSLNELPKIKDELLLLVELPFFTALYENEVKTPLLDTFAGFMQTLGSKKLKVSEAVVSYATADGQVPLEYRFLGGYLQRYLSEPQKLKDGPPVTWELRSKAMNFETFFQTDDVLQAYADAIKLDPKDASLRFAMAMALLNQKDLDGLRAELDQAVAIDNGYYTEYTEMGRYFQSKNMPEDAEYFLARAEKVNPQDPRIYSAQYDVYVGLKKYGKALEAVKKQMELGFGGPELLGQLAESEKMLGHYSEAEKAFNDALALIPKVDNQPRQKLLVGLGEAYELDRKVELAIKAYAEALQAMQEGHAKDKIRQRVYELDKAWSPFLNPSSQ